MAVDHSSFTITRLGKSEVPSQIFFDLKLQKRLLQEIFGGGKNCDHCGKKKVSGVVVEMEVGAHTLNSLPLFFFLSSICFVFAVIQTGSFHTSAGLRSLWCLVAEMEVGAHYSRNSLPHWSAVFHQLSCCCDGQKREETNPSVKKQIHPAKTSLFVCNLKTSWDSLLPAFHC